MFLNKELLAATVQALHVCLDDAALCRSLLATPDINAKHLQMAMIALNDCMPLDLTAGACMGRLCEVSHPLTEPGSQKFMTAASTHFDNVFYFFRNAMRVSQSETYAHIVAIACCLSTAGMLICLHVCASSIQS